MLPKELDVSATRVDKIMKTSDASTRNMSYDFNESVCVVASRLVKNWLLKVVFLFVLVAILLVIKHPYSSA